MNRLILLAVMLLGLLAARTASGHDIGAMRVDLQFPAGGGYRLDVVVDLDHVPKSCRTDFFSHLKAKSTLSFDGAPTQLDEPVEESTVVEDGKPTSRRHALFAGKVPEGARSAVWETRLDMPEYYFVTGQADADARPFQWLSGKAASAPVPIGGSAPAPRGHAFARYIALGFTHIVPEGTDHILFVLSLFLAGSALRPLLAQVTAFTVAHTITLGLSTYGVVSIPSSLVEPLIAVSIVAVAVENILVKEVRPHRVGLVFAFGLLHGLGFASVLSEVGLPQTHLAGALAGFNIGVELGQLSVLLAAYAAVGAWFSSRRWYRARIVVPSSAAICAVALFWTAQRVMGG